MTMTVKELLEKARDRIDQSWFKGSWRDGTSSPDEECAICAIGALNFIVSGQIYPPFSYEEVILIEAAAKALEECLPEDWTPREARRRLIPQFNDDPLTQKDDMLALFDRAIRRAN